MWTWRFDAAVVSALREVGERKTERCGRAGGGDLGTDGQVSFRFIGVAVRAAVITDACRSNARHAPNDLFRRSPRPLPDHVIYAERSLIAGCGRDLLSRPADGGASDGVMSRCSIEQYDLRR